jgi:hypothetical protein
MKTLHLTFSFLILFSKDFIPLEAEYLQNAETWVPMHFVHKALKKYLRGQENRIELQHNVLWLKETLEKYSPYPHTTENYIRPIAQIFLKTVQTILQSGV